MKSRSNYLAYLLWKYLPVWIIGLMGVSHFVENRPIQDYINFDFLILILFLVTMFFLGLRCFCEAVVDEDGLVLNQKNAVLWRDVSEITMYRTFGFSYLRYNVHHQKAGLLFFRTSDWVMKCSLE